MTWCSGAKKKKKKKKKKGCCVSTNKEKSSTMLFTLPKQTTWTIKLGNSPLQSNDESTNLGITFDKKHTWKPHIQKAESKARRKLSILRKLAGNSLCVPASSLPLPWVWFNNMVNHSKDQPASAGQGPIPSDRHNHWLHEIHTNKGYEDNCCCRTSVGGEMPEQQKAFMRLRSTEE